MTELRYFCPTHVLTAFRSGCLCLHCGSDGFCAECGDRHTEPGKCWQVAVGPEIRDWALATIAERSSGQPCVDAERCALKNSKTAVKRFKRSRSCCGLEEWTEIGPDGREYLLGFNFGH